MNFIRVDRSTLIAGIVVSDLPLVPDAGRRRRRSEPDSLVKRSELARALAAIRAITSGQLEEFDAERSRLRDEYLSSARYREEVLNEIRPLLDQALNQSHDFLALLSQIRANVLAIFEAKFPSMPAQDAAEKLPNEGAIFFASELMRAKLDATKYLREPNLISKLPDELALHRLVLKYIRIYQCYAEQRDIRINVGGASYSIVKYPEDALGAIAQAILDNAVKYAPTGSRISVVFTEGSGMIDLRVTSLGPRIEEDELARIFLPGFRSAEARRREAGGMGLGLAVAKVVADIWDISLTCRQSDAEDREQPGYYETTFLVRFEILRTRRSR